MLVGREYESKIMNELLDSSKSEFLALTGRRRIGKTFLVNNLYKNHLAFQITGIQNGSFHQQLTNFGIKLKEHARTPYTSPPTNWQEAFLQLKQFTRTLSRRKKKHVLFFDELPWIQTPRSGFLEMLAHFWNDYLSKESHYILVVCGSATSWITQRIINARGGLHNRITQSIHLYPFTLSETESYLAQRKISLTHQSIAGLYMIMGGIPFYLEQIRRGESPAQTIERVFFSEHAPLKAEYHNLYQSLFSDAKNHEAIVEVLAHAKSGLLRNEIIRKSKVPAGGPYDRAMQDLIASGFVFEQPPYGKKKRGSIYRLIDEYSIFYHRFIKKMPKKGTNIWLSFSNSQSYKIWCGYAFESLVLKHIQKIKDALGISAVYTEISTLRVNTKSGREGFDIDLILDRRDQVINLVEIKYYAGEFIIDKKYALRLRNRRFQFQQYTGTKKQVFNTFISNHGVKSNDYAKELVDSEVTLDQLF